MKIHAKEIRAGELKAGDLFSTAPQQYWDSRDPEAIGEKVYLRTETPCPQEQEDVVVYLVTIEERG